MNKERDRKEIDDLEKKKEEDLDRIKL